MWLFLWWWIIQQLFTTKSSLRWLLWVWALALVHQGCRKERFLIDYHCVPPDNEQWELIELWLFLTCHSIRGNHVPCRSLVRFCIRSSNIFPFQLSPYTGSNQFHLPQIVTFWLFENSQNLTYKYFLGALHHLNAETACSSVATDCRHLSPCVHSSLAE